MLNTINVFKFIDGFADKLNARGKAKHIKSGEGIEVEIYDSR